MRSRPRITISARLQRDAFAHAERERAEAVVVHLARDRLDLVEGARALGVTLGPAQVRQLLRLLDELALWKQMKASGYQTYSVSSTPGMSTIAFWIAQQALAGKMDGNKGR